MRWQRPSRCSTAMRDARSHGRLPAFGRELVEAQRAGRNVPWLLIALGWNIGRAMPRVVVTLDIPAAAWDLGLVRGLDCMVAHSGDQQRGIELAEQALRSGARLCPVYDLATGAYLSTAEIAAARGLVTAA